MNSNIYFLFFELTKSLKLLKFIYFFDYNTLIS